MILIYSNGNINTVLKTDDIKRAKDVAIAISRYEPCYFESRNNIFFFNNGNPIGKIKEVI